MKTEELISALAVDTLPQPKVSSLLWRALPLAVAVSLCAFALFWGPRPDIVAAMSSYAVLKTLGPVVLVALAMAVAVATVHPATSQKIPGVLLGAVIAVALGVFSVFLAREGQSALVHALSIPDLWVCLLSVPVLAVPMLGGVLWALSSGATTSPRLTGALAGLVAGGAAASVYSLYCNKDMVLFVLPAYSSAIAVVVLAGAALGPRLLRW
ncbi:DUF1109 domain-containing protein [Roseinatronobacter sp.]|uniref:DUF1109 domain-containing protein n=1 Tax=Roseinatronobacter sp. TaxID=1945755 RepID=UPI0025E7CDA9|nr:DUF1109 domain-containing protein [Roseibaca sp.]